MAHPIHPALVHFPVACWSLATLADCGLILFALDTRQLAGTLHIIGLTTAILAMLAGLVEITKISSNDTPTLRLANLHMGAATTTWCLYAASVFTRLDGAHLATQVSMLSFSLSVAGFLGLAVTGWLGGTLVYKYRVGVEAKKPS